MPSKIKTNVAYGRYPALINLANDPIIAQRAPTNNDKWEKGQLWDDETTNQVWMLTSYFAGQPVWTELDNNYLGITWITSGLPGPINLAVNTGYTFSNAGTVTVLLPAVASVGSQLFLNDSNAAGLLGGILITQNAGQTIHYGALASTPGVGGNASMIGLGQQTDSIWLICTVANTDWTIFTANGAVALV